MKRKLFDKFTWMELLESLNPCKKTSAMKGFEIQSFKNAPVYL